MRSPIPSRSPLIDENNTRVPTKEEAAALKMKPGSARDLHKDHIAALSAKQGSDPEPSPVLGPRGGDSRGRGGSDARREGPGWGDRGDRDWDRFGDRWDFTFLMYCLLLLCVGVGGGGACWLFFVLRKSGGTALGSESFAVGDMTRSRSRAECHAQ